MESASHPDRSQPIAKNSMALGAARPPHFPPGGAGDEVEGRVREGTTVQYRVSFTTILARLRCHVEGCRGSASSRTNLRVHFSHRHSKYSIVILEEGNQPHPQCPQCEMFVPQEALNSAHQTSAMCQCGLERKRWGLVIVEMEERMGIFVSVYEAPLMELPSFNYLGGIFCPQTMIFWKWSIICGGRG